LVPSPLINMKKLSMQQWANILKVVVIIAWLFLMNSIMSCSSPQKIVQTRTQKYYDKVVKNKQYAIVNNQIIIFENN